MEWCQAQERAARYEEKVQLVVEEMRRTLVFSKWLAREWEGRALTSKDVDNTTKHGISAYAHKQAAIYRKLVDVFILNWYECLKQKSLGSSWLKDYPIPPPVKRQRLTSNVHLYHSRRALRVEVEANREVVIFNNDDVELTDDF